MMMTMVMNVTSDDDGGDDGDDSDVGGEDAVDGDDDGDDFPKALHTINCYHTIVIFNINTSSRLSNSEYHTIAIFLT